MSQRVVLLSAVRNEADLIKRVVGSVVAQTSPPHRWVVFDDGSTDGTLEILRTLERDIDWLEVHSGALAARTNAQGLAEGSPSRAFNRLLARLTPEGCTHVAILDGDVELPRECLEVLLLAFRDDPGLGIVGPDLLEPGETGWRTLRVPDHHVHGAMRVYARACLEGLRPLPELLGWDTIDQAQARMNGWRTRRLEHVVARHHRPWGAADGALRGRARYGAAAYVGGQPPSWVLLRAAKLGRARPRGASGLAFLAGYCGAALRRTTRAGDSRYRRFVRSELRGRFLPRRPA